MTTSPISEPIPPIGNNSMDCANLGSWATPSAPRNTTTRNNPLIGVMTPKEPSQEDPQRDGWLNRCCEIPGRCPQKNHVSRMGRMRLFVHLVRCLTALTTASSKFNLYTLRLGNHRNQSNSTHDLLNRKLQAKFTLASRIKLPVALPTQEALARILCGQPRDTPVGSAVC